MTGKTAKKNSPMVKFILDAYQAGEEDEALEPVVLNDENGEPMGRIKDGDYVVFYDIRGEREIQLSECLMKPDFKHFDNHGLSTNFVTMIEYDKNLGAQVAFPPEETLKNTLVETVTKAGQKVLKVVETEKAVHLSFFLNGKNVDAFDGEERRFPESLKVHNYGEHPKMKIAEVTETLLAGIEDDQHDLIIANFANVDVIGHVENKDAVMTAVESVDASAGKVVEAALRTGREVFITADHGTVEKWYYPDGTVDTGHTDSLVPFIYIGEGLGKDGGQPVLREGGSLIDVAPTVLDVMGFDKPEEMTGQTLFADGHSPERKPRKALLLITDGWGLIDETEGNLIAAANTPNMDRLMVEHPCTRIVAAGERVGMPEGTVGNSESGHLHIGSGRTVNADRQRIDLALKDGSYEKNPAFIWAIEGAVKDGRPLHLLGIVSFYSSHGSLHHLMALMKMAKEHGVKEVYIHSLLGRRGERPEAGAAYIRDVEEEGERLGLGRVVTVIGRHWALDREFNWDRTEKTFRAMVDGVGRRVG